MRREETFTIDISVGSERVATHKIKAHDAQEAIGKLVNQYSTAKGLSSFENKE